MKTNHKKMKLSKILNIFPKKKEQNTKMYSLSQLTELKHKISERFDEELNNFKSIKLSRADDSIKENQTIIESSLNIIEMISNDLVLVKTKLSKYNQKLGNYDNIYQMAALQNLQAAAYTFTKHRAIIHKKLFEIINIKGKIDNLNSRIKVIKKKLNDVNTFEIPLKLNLSYL